MALLKIFVNEILNLKKNWYGWVVFYEQENLFYDPVSIMVTINVTINFTIIFFITFSVGVHN